MPASGAETDTRGVSEATGVATLMVMTLLVTATVGVGVLFVESPSEAGINGNFSFEHLDERGTLLIAFEKGDEFEAGRVVVSGPLGNVTWAESSGYNASRILVTGDTIQLGKNGPYGATVQSTDTFVVAYNPEDGNITALSRWNPDTL